MGITYASSSNVVTSSATDPRVLFEPEYVAVVVDGTPYSFATASIELLRDGYKLISMGDSGSGIFIRPGKRYTYYD